MTARTDRRSMMLGLNCLSVGVWASGALAQSGTVHEIEISQFRFTPDRLMVRPGDEVRWTNRDLAPHTVTAQDRSFDSGRIGKDESWSLVITEDTTEEYFCAFHPRMQAVLEIMS